MTKQLGKDTVRLSVSFVYIITLDVTDQLQYSCYNDIMTQPVANSIIRKMTDDSSSSHHFVPYYLFIDMEVAKSKDTHPIIRGTTAKDATDGILSSIRGFRWCNGLLVALEVVLRFISENETNVEIQYTKVNSIIAQIFDL